ncbi:diphthine--ammonia ligase [Polaribacter undariae]|uniref:Diphthine--ammonia ligase n=1 Tax=Polaribacter sejongensis TaxID=985043 RepID=A0AAJ1QY42_9FLAO|nr:diphthine--ammonia ligase [Polaribacter undariae]MDN3620464.1 diphthine--ammonia ligase [Polaribacter undariae]UWD33332.1 diphthine--ammonia ligase [Polaribacter undariae]
MKKTYFNWSSGKDSALALYKISQDPTYNLDLLVTTINKDFNRVSMHGLRNELLLKQAESIGINLKTIEFPADVTMDLYAEIMKEAMDSLVENKYSHTIFGDIFLEDLKAYRDTKLAEVHITGVYPLWKKDTKEVLKEFLDLGFKAITVCVNAKLLGEEFLGRVIDEQFIKDLPDNVDVCGENGEFHTFVFDGPIFKTPIDFTIGEKVLRSYTLNDNEDDNCHQSKKENSNHDTSFWYCDLS